MMLWTAPPLEHSRAIELGLVKSARFARSNLTDINIIYPRICFSMSVGWRVLG
jgi:hypothetical protein